MWSICSHSMSEPVTVLCLYSTSVSVAELRTSIRMVCDTENLTFSTKFCAYIYHTQTLLERAQASNWKGIGYSGDGTTEFVHT